jgi:valyl-tRNA synthetase
MNYALYPPPNITGKLHMGHFFMSCILDCIVRSKQITNHPTAILPGYDHGGIATYTSAFKYYGHLPNEQEVHAVAMQYKAQIEEALKCWPISFDWSKQNYTMDPAHTELVEQAFCQLYDRGLIQEEYTFVNWDTGFKTAISDLEVDLQTKTGLLYELPYRTDIGDTLIVATTRPETMFGDVALAVNPTDVRYQKYIGHIAYIPLLNKAIPIVADEYVTMDFGTGVLKVTPGHDVNDTALAKKHGLEIINIFDDEDNIVLSNVNVPDVQKQNAEICFAKGRDVQAVRKQIVAILNLSFTTINQRVPISSRSKQPVEYCLKKQWFLNMDVAAQKALAHLNAGNIQLFPEGIYENNMKNWLLNIKPWCISRSIPWGHTLPVWYDGPRMVVSTHCPGERYVRSNLKLDTWFSSALWPLSYKKQFDIFPFDILVTGNDIIFFWVARMIMMSLLLVDELPFRQVYLHGLVRDKYGNKMSKTMNNVIDPQEEIEKYNQMYGANYGHDTLRCSLLLQLSPNTDVKAGCNIEIARNLITKLYNLATVVEKYTIENMQHDVDCNEELVVYWQNRIDQFVVEVHKLVHETALHTLIDTIIKFIYEISRYLAEFAKVRSNLRYLLRTALKYILISCACIVPYTATIISQRIFDKKLLGALPTPKTTEVGTATLPQHDLIACINTLNAIKGVRYTHNGIYKDILSAMCNLTDGSNEVIINNIKIYVTVVDHIKLQNYIDNKMAVISKLRIDQGMPETIRVQNQRTKDILLHEILVLKSILNVSDPAQY